MDDIIYDLCIVGAGFFGSVAARHASAYPNTKVCLIGLDEPEEKDLKNRDIFSSHYDEGRILEVISEQPEFQKLASASIQRLRCLEKKSGIKFYNPVGFMYGVAKGSRHMKNLLHACAVNGTPLTHLSDQHLINKMYPFIKVKEDECFILETDGAGIVSARKVLSAERKIAREQGCHIMFDIVKDVEPLKNDYHIVHTAVHGDFKSKRVLFTAGAFTNVNHFKILPQLEIYVYKEMATMVRISHSEAKRLSSMPGLVMKRDENDIGNYILPPVLYPDGKYYLKVGSREYDSGKGMQTSSEIKEWFLSKEVPGETTTMSKPLFRMLPDLAHEGIFRKVCVTCETPTLLPYIDQVTPTVTLAVAGNGWGVTLSEEVGRLAAVLSLKGTWDSDIPKSLFKIILKRD